ncbi:MULTISPECIES: cell wall-active antibiotics response protein LiaF [Jeotgalibacillus]|uniref:cell wall-active antibiotics response protein LiaF n=1 Tax=Jeotgalibacillus TaxID=157226 RepID=UPI00141BF459|nr:MULTISPECIES: cell wall-active antibiotics response protein LiaF [Jeotgalibacillus]
MKWLKEMSLSNWVTACLVLVFIEIILFNSGMIFSFAVAGAFIYFGKRRWDRLYGKILLGVGALSLLTAVLSMVTLRILAVVLIVYLIMKYTESKKDPVTYRAKMESKFKEDKERLLLSKKPFFLNKWVGSHSTPDHSFEWEDIHLQNGIGDVLIDLSNTVLPDREVFISMRNLAGNITILVPYELDISIQHAAVAGEASIFKKHSSRLWNENLVYETEHYRSASQKVTIFTSVLVGDIEVKRV